MNIIFEKITDNYILKLAKFDADSTFLFHKIKDDLSTFEIEDLQKIKNFKRKTEWLGTRILLKNILKIYQPIKYNEKGNPFIETGKNISISHSGNYIAVIISENQYVGIDVEILSDRILKTAHKFVSEQEIAKFAEGTEMKNMYLHWCCKETLYKIKGGGGYDFKKDFILSPFSLKNSGKITAFITKSDKEMFSLSYRFINQDGKQLLLVWRG